jgi:Zn-dependent membrane protease YugP
MTLAILGGYYLPYFWVALPGALLAMWAQARLSSTYGRYYQVESEQGISGAEAARAILDRNGLANIEIYPVPGNLTDHYDPVKRAVFLSEQNFQSRSLAAVGVAAHEVGHAIQHRDAYALLGLRMALVSVTNISSNVSMLLIMIGMILSTPFAAKLLWAGVILFSVVAFFQLVTLPVEYDASHRAKEQLLRLGLVTGREQQGIARVLSAAALTYVAALVNAILQLLHLFLIARSRDRD